MAEHHQKLHAILLPYPLQGHVIPFVHLATKLASIGFTITFVNTESIHHQITKSNAQTDDENSDIFAEARRSELDIRYATVSDGFPLGFDRTLNHDQYFEGILHVFPAHVDELVGKLVDSGDGHPANCLVVDTFYVFSSAIAKKHNLVNISFWTEPALVFTLYYHLDLLRQNGHYGNFDNRDDIITCIPGVEEIEPTDLPSYLQSESSTIVHRIIHKAFADVKKADFVISNTVQELESKTISAQQENQPFYAIGPLFPDGFPKRSVATSLWPEVDCGKWLDTKPVGSVLFVSFGSYAHTSKRDIMEIAHGLVLSKVNFVWVLRHDIVSSDETDYLPPRYDRLIDHCGLIVPWCSQAAVLSHLAVGGFLTHCGWNSILESIWCNVPMICYPLLTDQFTNRKIVVDDWKIGIHISDKGRITRCEVAQKIGCLMSGKSSTDLNQEIHKVKKTLEDAVTLGGSSQKNLDQFAWDVMGKVVKKQPCIAKG